MCRVLSERENKFRTFPALSGINKGINIQFFPTIFIIPMTKKDKQVKSILDKGGNIGVDWDL